MLRKEKTLWLVLHWFVMACAILALSGSIRPPSSLAHFTLPAQPNGSGVGPSEAPRRLASPAASEPHVRASSNQFTQTFRFTQALQLAPTFHFTQALSPALLPANSSLSLPATGSLALPATGSLAPPATGSLDGVQVEAGDPKLAFLADRQVQTSRTRVVTEFSFPKWTGAQQRYWAHDPAFASLCAEILAADCGLDDWSRFLGRVASRDPAKQLELVNAWVNRVPYRADKAVWGEHDYWAAPGEFLANGGDCEDYAIAKYYSLKDLGFPVEAMRIVVLNDKRRRQVHAVLVVTWQGEDLVLDSLDQRIRSWNEVRHYHALYSFNEDAYWLHRGPTISKT